MSQGTVSFYGIGYQYQEEQLRVYFHCFACTMWISCRRPSHCVKVSGPEGHIARIHAIKTEEPDEKKTAYRDCKDSDYVDFLPREDLRHPFYIFFPSFLTSPPVPAQLRHKNKDQK